MYCVVLFSLAVFVLALILLYHLARKFYHKNYLQIRMNLYSTFDSLKTGFYAGEGSSLQSDVDDFPQTDEPVYILGIKYSSLHELDEIRADVRSRIWCTYRRSFPSIGDSGMTADSGWGCMLRTGQMVLAQAFCNIHLGRDWRWRYVHQSSLQALRQDGDEAGAKEYQAYLRYRQVVRLFADAKLAPYSIHQIALMGACEGKQVGEWFGPNTVAQVLKKLSVYDKFNDICIHVAMDNMVFTDDIKKQCHSRRTYPAKRSGNNNNNDHGGEQSAPEVNGLEGSSTSMSPSSSSSLSWPTKEKFWRPLILFIPLRLGLTQINPIYFRALKSTFAFPQTLGILGGRPNHALYFIGCVGDTLICLDPHTTQPTVEVSEHLDEYIRQQERWAKDEEANMGSSATTTPGAAKFDIELDDISYHTERASRLPLAQLDPSISLAFLFKTEEEFDQWATITLKKDHDEKTPLFEIMKARPANWPAMEEDVHLVRKRVAAGENIDTNTTGEPFTDLESDEDFEIIE